MKYKPKRVYVWSAELAYVVGLITADGCLLNDKRHIDFTSKDLQLVELYKMLIRPNAKIGTKLSGNGVTCYRVQLGDVAFYDFLLRAGLTQHKSKTLEDVKVPSRFFADFVRGYFDGDGSVYGGWDKRWKNSYMFYSAFASASPIFLKWLKSKLATHIPELSGSVKGQQKGMYQLCYAKKDSKLLFRFMYYKKTLPCLTRKFDRYLEILDLDPYAYKIKGEW